MPPSGAWDSVSIRRMIARIAHCPSDKETISIPDVVLISNLQVVALTWYRFLDTLRPPVIVSMPGEVAFVELAIVVYSPCQSFAFLS